MTTRQKKVNSVIQREIAEYLLEDLPEGIIGIVTILKVDVTEDLEHAKVFFSVVGQDEAPVLAVLKKNIYNIQGRLYDRLTMRRVPRIAFFPDESGKYADHISKLLNKLHDK